MFNEISQKQAHIFLFPHLKYNALICDGAIRTGKTTMMAVSFVLWAMSCFNRMNFGICGKTVRSAERNIISPLRQLTSMRRRYRMKYTRSSSLLTVTDANGRENYFYIFGGKDESSYMLIQGITLAGVLLDEVALMPESFINQALARCSVDGSKYWFNCNPASPSHWFYQEWVQAPEEKNALYVHFLLEDNPGLSEDKRKQYYSDYSGVFFDRYILGKWVVAEGAIYRIFSENKERYYTDRPDFDFIQIGVDFGGNKSAHAFCATGLKYDYDKLTALMTERHDAAGLTPDDLYRLLEQFINRVRDKYGKVTCIIPDSAEQTLKNGIKSRFSISVRDSLKRPIIDRIRATTSIMSQGKFYMTRDCASLDAAFENAVYSDKSLQDERLDDGTSDIDSLDAFEYSWERYLRQYETR